MAQQQQRPKHKRNFTIRVEGHADVVAEYNVEATSPEEAAKLFEQDPAKARVANPPIIVNPQRMRKYRLAVKGSTVTKTY